MKCWHTEPGRSLSFEIELNHNSGLGSHYPAVMTRFDNDHLRRRKLLSATVFVSDVDLALREEANMRVHAPVRAHNRLHVCRPSKARRIDHALHPAGAGFH